MLIYFKMVSVGFYLTGIGGRINRSVHRLEVECSVKDSEGSPPSGAAREGHHRARGDRLRQDGGLRAAHPSGPAAAPAALLRPRPHTHQGTSLPDIRTV